MNTADMTEVDQVRTIAAGFRRAAEAEGVVLNDYALAVMAGALVQDGCHMITAAIVFDHMVGMFREAEPK